MGGPCCAGLPPLAWLPARSGNFERICSGKACQWARASQHRFVAELVGGAASNTDQAGGRAAWRRPGQIFGSRSRKASAWQGHLGSLEQASSALIRPSRQEAACAAWGVVWLVPKAKSGQSGWGLWVGRAAGEGQTGGTDWYSLKSGSRHRTGRLATRPG